MDFNDGRFVTNEKKQKIWIIVVAATTGVALGVAGIFIVFGLISIINPKAFYPKVKKEFIL